MTKLKLIASLVFVGLSLIQHSVAAEVTTLDTNHIYSVSMVNLISNPEKYDGKKVHVEGVFQFYFSDSALFSDKEGYARGATQSAIVLRLDVKAKDIDKYNSWTGRYVKIEGVVDSKDRGHLNGYLGAIKNISLIKLLPEK